MGERSLKELRGNRVYVHIVGERRQDAMASDQVSRILPPPTHYNAVWPNCDSVKWWATQSSVNSASLPATVERDHIMGSAHSPV